MLNLKRFFFVVCQAKKYLISHKYFPATLPAGRMEKGAKVCRCRSSTSRGCSGVTVTTVIKTGLCIKSMHRVPQRLARCNRVDRVFFFLFNFIPLFHPFFFFPPSFRTKMLETVTHNSLVWTCETGHKTADRQRVPCRKRSTKLQPYWTVFQKWTYPSQNFVDLGVKSLIFKLYFHQVLVKFLR